MRNAGSRKLIIHPYPNFLFRIPFPTPSFPPVLSRNGLREDGRHFAEGADSVSKSRTGTVGRNVGQVRANRAATRASPAGRCSFPRRLIHAAKRIDFGEGLLA